MIELEKLKAVDHIIVHDNCPDGTASAMILHDALPNARITFCQYGTPGYLGLEARPNMLFCDFSPQGRAQEFLDVGTIVLDHHGGAAAVITKQFVERGQGAFADEKLDPGVSGALLAFNEVWVPLYIGALKDSDFSAKDSWIKAMQEGWRDNPDSHIRTVSDLAVVAGIRDTWQKQDPRWREACEQAEALRFWPWEKILATPWNKWGDELLPIGPILYERNMRHVQKCLDGSFKFHTPKGKVVTVFEGLKPTSDAAELVGEGNQLVVGLAFLVEQGVQRLLFSTRSRGGVNCQALAMAHGGGGHLQAAGFSQELKPGSPQPYTLVQDLLNRYEAVEDEWIRLSTSEDFLEKVKKGELVPQKAYAELVKGVQPRTWGLHLNEYQRDNLVWLLQAVGYPYGKGVEPFTYANTGDWVGELALQLNCELGVGRPNVSLDALRESVSSYISTCERKTPC